MLNAPHLQSLSNYRLRMHQYNRELLVSLVLSGTALFGIVLLVFLYFLCNMKRQSRDFSSFQTPPPGAWGPPLPMTNQQPTAPPAPTDQMNLPTNVENQLAIIRAQMALIQQQQQQQQQ